MRGLEKEGAKFRAGREPAETQAKIVQWTILPTRLAGGSSRPHQNGQTLCLTILIVYLTFIITYLHNHFFINFNSFN